MNVYLTNLRCSTCRSILDEIRTWDNSTRYVHPAHGAITPPLSITHPRCPHEGEWVEPITFKLPKVEPAPPPPGPSIDARPPTPPLAPTPSPAGGSNEDMGPADPGPKKEESKSGPEKSQHKNTEKGPQKLGLLTASDLVESLITAAYYNDECPDDARMRSEFERLVGLAFSEAVKTERVAGLGEVVPREPGSPEWVPCDGQCGAYWSDGKAKMGCWYGVGHSGHHSFQEPLLPREKVVDVDVEYWRKRGLDAELEVAAIRQKGIEIANESRRTREALSAAERQVAWLTESNETLQKIAEDRFQKWQAAEKWGKEQAARADRDYKLAQDVTEQFNAERGRLAAAEKHIEILRAESTRRPEPPREKVRQVQDALHVVTKSLAAHIMQDRFGKDATVEVVDDQGPALAYIRAEVWGKGANFGEAVADAINRWNRGEEAYS